MEDPFEGAEFSQNRDPADDGFDAGPGGPDSGTPEQADGTGELLAEAEQPAAGDQDADFGAGGVGEGRGGEAEGGEDPGEDRGPGLHQRAAADVDWRAVGAALREAEGDRRLVALACGITEDHLSRIISSRTELSSIWGTPIEIKLSKTIGQRETPEVEGLGPDEVTRQFFEADRELMANGLSKLGLKPSTIQKLRDLEGLAEGSGKFLSMSVQTMHQMFFGQMMHLFERAEHIRETFLMKEDLPVKERMYWNRLYMDMVREIGKGYKLTFDGARALTEMLLAGLPAPPTAESERRVNDRPPRLQPALKRERPGFSDV